MEEREKILLVEGKNDMHVINKLIDVGEKSLSGTFNIKDCESNSGVIKQFELLLMNSKIHAAIGVILDADENAQARMDAIKHRLLSTNAYNKDDIVLKNDGLVLHSTDESRYPKIGVWIMPNNKLPGMLEDFLLQMVSDDDLLLTKSEEVLQTLEQEGINRYTKAHRPKAKIHTYLAWQREPGKPLSQAIKSEILNPESESSKIFLAWLQRLFCNTNN